MSQTYRIQQQIWWRKNKWRGENTTDPLNTQKNSEVYIWNWALEKVGFIANGKINKNSDSSVCFIGDNLNQKWNCG